MIVYGFAIVLVGLAIDLMAYLVHLNTGLKLQGGPPVSIMFFGFWITGLILKFLAIGSASLKDVSVDLQSRFEILCWKLKLSNQKLLITQKSQVTGLIFKDEVFVTTRAVIELSPPAIEFILGHELAHRRFFSIRQPETIRPKKWLGWVLVGLAIISLTSLRLEMPWPYYILICLPLISSLIYLSFKIPTAATSAGRDMEFACDFVAITVMSEPKAAIEALCALSHGSKFDQKLSGYPSKEQRLEQVQRFLSGEPRLPFKNKFVEENIKLILADLEPSKLQQTDDA